MDVPKYPLKGRITMKKLLLTLTVLALCVLAMSSCDMIDDLIGNGNEPPVETPPEECLHENLAPLAAKKATCTEPGHTEGYVCLDCNTELGYTELPPFGHNTIDTPEKPATCEATGTTESKRCVSCREYVLAPTVIPMLPHNIIDSDDVEATCTESGSTGGKHCTECFTATEKATVIDPTGHTYEGGVCHCGAVDPNAEPAE